MARPRSDIAQRIVSAAAERFLHDGVDGASLRRIAQAAGTNLGMVYYYFPSKDDLFLAVVERHYAPLSQAIIEAIAAGPSFEQRVRALYDRFGALSDEEFVVVRLMLRESLVSSERLNRVFERMMQGHTPAMLALLTDGIASGHVAPDLHPAAALVTMAVLAVAPQVMLRRIAASVKSVELPEPAEMAKHMATVALRGVGAPGAAVTAAGPERRSPPSPEASPPTAPGRPSAARRRPR